MTALYTDISAECCAWLGSRVEDGSLPTGDVLLADIRRLAAHHLAGYAAVHCFAGIGGMALGLAWARWPAHVRVLTGGFPCQDIFAAGKGAGLAGKRSGLFWELVRVAEIYQPDVWICENVGALSRRGLDVVARAMGKVGYLVTEAYRVGAWALGAPHERERWWIVGYRNTGAFGDANRKRVRQQPGRRTRTHRTGAPGVGDAGAVDDGDEGRQRIDRSVAVARADAHEPMPDCCVQPDADGEQGRLHEPGRRSQGRAAVGWADPITDPAAWRRDGDEWHFAGSPTIVYAGGAGREEQHAAALPGGTRHAAGRSDPTLERGWVVPALPGYEQHGWEEPRLHQRSLGRAVHGVPGWLADHLNRCGVMACGNAVVPQVVAAVARGVVRGIQSQQEGSK